MKFRNLSNNAKVLLGTAALLSVSGIVLLAGGIVAANKRKDNKSINVINKKPTSIVKSINVAKFGINDLTNSTAQEAKDKITNQFIFEKKSSFLIGDFNINDANDIFDLQVTVSNNQLNVSFKLKGGCWYGADGNLGTTPKTFNTTIQNFKESEKKEETKVVNPIDAQVFGWDQISIEEAKNQITNQFMFENITKILIGSYKINNVNQITNINASVKNQTIEVSFILVNGCWYDADGNLGTTSKEFNIVIQNFKEPDKKQATIINSPLNTSQIGLQDIEASAVINYINETFIFDKLAIFVSGDSEIKTAVDFSITTPIATGDSVTFTLTIKNGKWYDANGDLGQGELTKTVVINISKQETKVINPIDASVFGWDQLTAEEANEQITKEFIVKNITMFLSGDHDIKNNGTKKVYDVNTTIINNSLNISFSLIPGTWYDKDGNLGSGSKTFTTVIINFKRLDQNEETKSISPIQAVSIGLNNDTAQEAKDKITNQFIYDKITNFIKGDHNITSASDIEVSVIASGNSLYVYLKLKSGTWYDANGDLGTSDKTFNAIIENFKESFINEETIVNNPIEAQVFGWDQIEASAAQSQITNTFIKTNITKFLRGSYLINDASQISGVSSTIQGQTIEVSFTLANGTWYDKGGNLGSGSKTFTTAIIRFKAPVVIKKETKVYNRIGANLLGLNNDTAKKAKDKITNQFIFDNLTNFINGDHKITSASDILEVSATVSDNSLNVSFKLKSRTWYDASGQLGTNNKLFDSITIFGFA